MHTPGCFPCVRCGAPSTRRSRPAGSAPHGSNHSGPESRVDGGTRVPEGGDGVLRPQWTVVSRLAAVLLFLGVAFGAAGVAAADGDGLVKVFVVTDPARSGRIDTLGSIAASTLGDANRASEVFDLNRGRVQPDGGALTDPGQRLHPGWILRLPPAAAGPDVRLARDTSQPSDTR